MGRYDLGTGERAALSIRLDRRVPPTVRWRGTLTIQRMPSYMSALFHVALYIASYVQNETVRMTDGKTSLRVRNLLLPLGLTPCNTVLLGKLTVAQRVIKILRILRNPRV
jgi:hypothetical protein